ncbi:MAG: hypothetical protein ACLTQI_09605 [Slackia sp.]
MNKDNTNALLDKVENTARRIALALGGMFIASIASAILVNEWIIEQWRTSTMSFIGGMLAAALLGACMACCALTPVLRSKINRLSHELEKRPTQEHLNEALAEKDSRMEAALAERDARIAELETNETSTHRARVPVHGMARPSFLLQRPQHQWFVVSGDEIEGFGKDEISNMPRVEARDAGFLNIEECGIDRMRATDQEARGAVRGKAGDSQEDVRISSSRGHEEAANTPDVDWRDVELIENGAMIIPKDAPK